MALTKQQRIIQSLYKQAEAQLAEQAVLKNKKQGYIAAIKLVREVAGVGLGEARDRVEQYLLARGVSKKNTPWTNQ
jgi:ribosomal protein L7/L12